MKDRIGRRFEFKRVDGRIVPIRELPSKTWFHADGTIQPIEIEDRQRQTNEQALANPRLGQDS